MARYFRTAGDLINDVAVDVGLDPVADPIASQDRQFVQLKRQLEIALDELASVHEWEWFKREHTFVTDSGTNPDGVYELPTNFHYMIDQTHWDRSGKQPLEGPVSSQEWQYLQASTSSPLSVMFRQRQGKLELYPTPPPDGLMIAFEYQSTDWVHRADGLTGCVNCIVDSADEVRFPPSLMRAFLKSKFLSSKGFQTISAEQAVSLYFDTAAGKDKGAPILSLSGGRGQPFLGSANVPETGFGA